MKKTIFILPLFAFSYVIEWAAMPQRLLANQAQPKPEMVAITSSNWDHTLDVGDTPKDIRVILPEHYQAKVTIGSTSKKKGQQAVSYKMFKGMAETVKSIPNGKVSIKVELIPLRSGVMGKPVPSYQVEMIPTPWTKKKRFKRNMPVRIIVPGIATNYRSLGTPSQRQSVSPDTSRWPVEYVNNHRKIFRYQGETPVMLDRPIELLPVTIGPGPLTVDTKSWPSNLRGQLAFYASDSRYSCHFLINYSSQHIKIEGLNAKKYTRFCNPGRKINGEIKIYRFDNRLKSTRCRPTLCPEGPRMLPTGPPNITDAVKKSPVDLTFTVLWPGGRYTGPVFSNPVKIF